MNEYKKPSTLEQAKVMKAYIEKYIITLTEYKESKNFDSVEDFETSIKKLDNLMENLKKDFPELFLL